MSNAIDWAFAERIAVSIAGREPFSRSYHYSSIAEDFEELTARAQGLVEAHTGWTSTAGAARARVVDRPGWVRANVASFQRMLRPLTDRLEEQVGAGLLAPVASRVAGAELGAMLGWMSTRVLGQYDMLVLDEEHPEHQDLVYYVGPNILSMEKRFAFAPREFRLWIALHEVTHRTQFTGVPWLRHHFLTLMGDLLGMVEPDPSRAFHAVGRVAESLRNGRNPLSDGVFALLASPHQRTVLDQVGGLMSLLEGHGDVTMDRAGADEIPSAERFGRVLRSRRSNVALPARWLQRLVGLEAKMAQYEQGERFIEAIETRGGPELLNRAFESAVSLPTLPEIRDPDVWLGRMRSAVPA